MRFRHVFGWLWLACLLVLVMVVGMPLAAQEDSPGFATNTPPPTPLALATNTPQPRLNPVVAVPAAPEERYALRRWDETTLVNVLLEQVGRLMPGEVERQQVIRLLQLELAQRFPNAPRRPEQREQLLQAMLKAPRGSVDMRSVVRPYVVTLLDGLKPPLDVFNTYTAAGFSLEMMPLDLDGSGTLEALVHIQYPADATTADTILYDDYVPVHRIGEVYSFLDGVATIPAAPFNNIAQVSLERVSDVNQDGLEEFVLSLDYTNAINREFLIFGWRSASVANLIQPGQALQFGSLVEWPRDSNHLTVTEYQVESPEWNCLGERDITWSWIFNFFRPAAEPGEYSLQNSTGCRLYQTEPLFELPVDEAITTIENVIQTATLNDAAVVDRAAMMVAMLRVLEGRADLALGQVERLAATAESGSWLAAQTAAFQTIAAQSNTTPLLICATLQHATAYGVCDVDQVLARQFSQDPLRRDLPIRDQLDMRGIPVSDMVTLSGIGQFDRQAVRFVLAGYDYWWAFAPLARDTYTAEAIDPPTAFQPVTQQPEKLMPPPGALRMLLDSHNASAVLGQIDNLIQENPGIPLDSAARFLQAFSYDLIGARDNAKHAYFTLWSDDPTSIWGQLAAAHLELR
ncbi:MAG: hypothetical protein H6672_12820 [Anaerolineaceae bacterium]|nr:hypothetical protein [Anaerolineaceae bacterium]